MLIVEFGIPHVLVEPDVKVVDVAAGDLAQRLERHPAAVPLYAVDERVGVQRAVFLECAAETFLGLEAENAQRHVGMVAFRRSETDIVGDVQDAQLRVEGDAVIGGLFRVDADGDAASVDRDRAYRPARMGAASALLAPGIVIFEEFGGIGLAGSARIVPPRDPPLSRKRHRIDERDSPVPSADILYASVEESRSVAVFRTLPESEPLHRPAAGDPGIAALRLHVAHEKRRFGELLRRGDRHTVEDRIASGMEEFEFRRFELYALRSRVIGVNVVQLLRTQHRKLRLLPAAL